MGSATLWWAAFLGEARTHHAMYRQTDRQIDRHTDRQIERRGKAFPSRNSQQQDAWVARPFGGRLSWEKPTLLYTEQATTGHLPISDANVI